MTRIIASAAIVAFAVFGSVFGQDTLRDTFVVKTLQVPVTYYDFHADGSCPAFEARTWKVCETGCGLALDTLDADRKPIPNVARTGLDSAGNSYLIDHLEKWYRPWTPGDTLEWYLQPDTTVRTFVDSSATPETVITFFGPVISYPQKAETTYVPADTMRSDTMYKNVVIPDSLNFYIKDYTKISYTGMSADFVAQYDTTKYDSCYIFASTFNGFFPLDSAGFGKDGDTVASLHNYGWTMEIRNRVKYKGGEVIKVAGDDDIWVFLNHRIVFDMGGLHGAITKEMVVTDSLEALMGIQKGQEYDLDIFFAERHSTGSNFWYTSNFQLLEGRAGDSIVVTKTVPIDRDVIQVSGNRIFKNVPVNFGGKWETTAYVPSQTGYVAVEAFNASGGKVAGSGMVALDNVKGISIGAKNGKAAGALFIRLSCFDEKGRLLAIEPMRLVRTK